VKNPSVPIIFIIDENKVYAELIRQYLDLVNCNEILQFTCLEECYEFLDMQPDIIIAEYQYSTGNNQGLRFLKIIKSKSPETRLIFLTANSDVETAIKAIHAGATDYIIKSKYAPDKLLHKVIAIVGHKKEMLRNSAIRKKLMASVGFLLILTGCLIFFYTH